MNINLENAIVCHSRCLYCGRQTPHEVCHEHNPKTGGAYPSMATRPTCPNCGTECDLPDEIDYAGASKEPERCTDPNCASWEPGEYESVVLGVKPKRTYRWSVRLEWKPEDLWVGAFWRRRIGGRFDVFICFIPCLPICITREVVWP